MLQRVIDQRRRDLGGFEVGRVLPFGPHKMVGPFIFFDHIGPARFAPGLSRTADVRPHPHIGLSTVTLPYWLTSLPFVRAASRHLARMSASRWRSAP